MEGRGGRFRGPWNVKGSLLLFNDKREPFSSRWVEEEEKEEEIEGKEVSLAMCCRNAESLSCSVEWGRERVWWKISPWEGAGRGSVVVGSAEVT